MTRQIYHRRNLWLFFLAGLAALVHAGTAILRADTFWPYPRLLDFASFYTGALSIRFGSNPYIWGSTETEFLQSYIGIGIPAPNSTPVWLWALAPFTWLPFPVAATIWLLLLIGITSYCSILLSRIAGYNTWPATIFICLIVLTFGPTMLNLTLGQNGLFLLLSVLLAGQYLNRPSQWTGAAAAVSWTLSIAAKLFPLIWLPALALLRSWKLLFAILALFTFLSLVSHFLSPPASNDYWLRFLPGQATAYSDSGALDDQSLGAWLYRLGQSRQFSTPGLSVSERHQIEWQYPWELDNRAIDLTAYGILLAVGVLVVLTIIRTGMAAPDTAIFLWVLFCLILVPHTQRYNHVLLLPAMAWIWNRGEWGRACAIIVYFLAALSRLTHLWVLLLPAPFAPIMTGMGVLAVLLLIGCTARIMWSEFKQLA